MIDPKEISKKSDALSALLRSKIGIRGKTLEAQFRNSGRLLPKHIHAEAKFITKSQELSAHPKLSALVDVARVETAFDTITAHLKTVDPKDRRKGKLLGWLGYQVFNLMLIAGVLIAVLIWRGYIG